MAKGANSKATFGNAELRSANVVHRRHRARAERTAGNGRREVVAVNPKHKEESMDLQGRVCIVRTYSAGVFMGKIESRNGKEVALKDARRLWYWAGAASLSELATKGTSKPKQCKFPAPVSEVLLTEAIEILPISDAARKSIESVPEWTA